VENVLIELHHLPSIAYFNVLYKANKIVIEKRENFIKQSYRNRCHINSAQGLNVLTVPLTNKHGKVLITDIKIDYNQKWLNHHWRTIQSAYGNAPFFEYYSSDLHDTLFKKFNFLYDLNYNLLSMCLKWLKWEKILTETESFNKTSEGVLDLRNVINCKKVDENLKTIPYTQVFGNKFVPNLSIIDLVFCSGPRANNFILLPDC
jgi:hypothetical protein